MPLGSGITAPGGGTVEIKPANTRPIVITGPLEQIDPAPPVGTVENMGQQYEYQTYNADGKIITRKLSATVMVGTFNDFSPQDPTNLTDILRVNEARLLASPNFSPSDTNKILQDSLKIDYALCVRSQQSSPVEFNFLQTPTLQLQTVYNFYTEDEADLATQEDQTLDPLLTNDPVPRHVMLTWDVTSTVNTSPDFASRTRDEMALVRRFLNRVRGVGTLANQPVANSFQSNLASVPPVFRDGQSLQLVDTHDLERGFNSTSNSRLFKKTAVTTVNTNALDVNTIKFDDLILDDL
jgi:hypothetical protein